MLFIMTSINKLPLSMNNAFPSDIARLNADFAIDGQLHFEVGPGGLATVRIANPLASAALTLQGAHVFHFQPAGQPPLLWLSPQAQFAPGKPIRGGIPLCWPWFGAHSVHPDYPSHGLARTAGWQVIATATLAHSATSITLLLENDAASALWPHPCRAEYRVTVGSGLTVELETYNTGHEEFELSEALHAYFSVSDLDNIGVTGLDGCAYLDKADGAAAKVQDGTITFADEVDRIYLDTQAPCVIEDLVMQRRIHIAKHGSDATVVWNPGSEKAARLGDMGPGNHRNMVCVESANAAGNAVRLQPEQRHCLSATYWVEPF